MHPRSIVIDKIARVEFKVPFERQERRNILKNNIGSLGYDL